MAEKSTIEWTEATWNPIVGCSIVSPGCTNCYAMGEAARQVRCAAGHKRSTHYAGTTKIIKGKPVWTGKVARAPAHILTAPLRWKRGRKIFVNSMGDLFHESIPDEWIDRVFAVMALCPQHTFQVLTKRAERMRAYFADLTGVGIRIFREAMRIRPTFGAMMGLPLPNVWLGVSTERQQEADERREALRALATQGWTTFVSYEPALGPVDWRGWEFIAWLISGGESGRHARPSHPDWHLAARDFCAANDISYFFKQWGEFLPVGEHLPGFGEIHGATAVKLGRMKLHYGGTPKQAPKHAFVEHGVTFSSTADGRLTFRVGKKRAGRLLDGKEHNQFPKSDLLVRQGGGE